MSSQIRHRVRLVKSGLESLQSAITLINRVNPDRITTSDDQAVLNAANQAIQAARELYELYGCLTSQKFRMIDIIEDRKKNRDEQ